MFFKGEPGIGHRGPVGQAGPPGQKVKHLYHLIFSLSEGKLAKYSFFVTGFIIISDVSFVSSVCCVFVVHLGKLVK